MNYEISLSEHFNHKILYNSIPEDTNEHGVSGLCILDECYNKKSVSINYNDINFLCNGALAEADNIICNKQHIHIGYKNVNSMLFLGFNEFGNYEDDIAIISDCNSRIRKKIFFYGFNQILDTLYSVEMNDNCNVAVNTLANGYLNVNLYVYELKLDGINVEEIVLSDNPEMHIMAVAVKSN